MSTPTLLHLDASPRGPRSHSRKLGSEYLAAFRASHPEARIVVRDLGHEPPPFVTEAWVEGAYLPPDQHSPAARAAMTVSNSYVDELLAADQIVITTPMYNLSVPAVLKAWIDQIVRHGRTFQRSASGYTGLVSGKRVTVIVATGGDFRPGSPAAGYNFLEQYLRGIFGFIGISDVRFVYAHSLNTGDSGRERGLADARAALQQIAA